MINHTQITVRTFQNGKRIGKKHFDDNNLAAFYPSYFAVMQKYRTLIAKGNKNSNYFLDISETGIKITEQ
jgi:hypothetical protein